MSKWEMVRLGDVCEKTENENPTIYDKEILYVDISAIDSNDKRITMYNAIPSKTAPSRARQKVKVGDILVSTVRPNLNAVAIVDKAGNEIIASTGFCVLRPDEKRLNSKYLFEFVKSSSFISSMTMQATGASYPAVNNRIVMEEKIPLPPLTIQQKIAEILDLANTLIEKRKSQVEKLDLLIKSQFIEMFGDPVTNPMGWEIKQLVELIKQKSDLVDGPFGSSVNTKVDYIDNGEIPVIRTKNVGIFQFITDDLKYMSRDKYETVKRSQVLPGDIILTKVGTIGNLCIFPNLFAEAVLSTTGSCRIRANRELMCHVYLLHYLDLYRPQMIAVASTAVQAFLNMNHIKNFNIVVPPLALQNQFADFVNQVETQKAQLKKGLELLELNYKALMQKCFNGEVL